MISRDNVCWTLAGATVRALLVTILALLSAASHAGFDARPHLEFVCGSRFVDAELDACLALPAPQLKIEPLGRALGQYRLWADPDSIYLSPYVRDELLFHAIVVHEVSHYADWKLHKLPLSERLWYEARRTYTFYLCWSEGQAWRVYHAWLIAFDYPQSYDRYNWLDVYPHCTTGALA